MTTLNDQQRAKLRFVKKTVNNLGSAFKIHGRLGTFEYLGIIPDAGSTDLLANGISRTVQRPAGRRSRWLGDSQGYNVAGGTANVRFYGSRDGSVLPGRPITLVNLDVTDEETGNHPTGTLSIEGSIGAFIQWLGQNRPSFRTQIYGPSGRAYEGIISPED